MVIVSPINSMYIDPFMSSSILGEERYDICNSNETYYQVTNHVRNEVTRVLIRSCVDNLLDAVEDYATAKTIP